MIWTLSTVYIKTWITISPAMLFKAFEMTLPHESFLNNASSSLCLPHPSSPPSPPSLLLLFLYFPVTPHASFAFCHLHLSSPPSIPYPYYPYSPPLHFHNPSQCLLLHLCLHPSSPIPNPRHPFFSLFLLYAPTNVSSFTSI